MNRNSFTACFVSVSIFLLHSVSIARSAHSVKLSQPIARYGLGSWAYGALGNHRAVVTVSPQSARSRTVKVIVPWRRRDDDAGRSNILLRDPDGKTVANRLATVNTRDKLELVFKPTCAGEYGVYYLAQGKRPAGRYNHLGHFPATFYQQYVETADAKWKTAALAAKDHATATLKEIQARSEYHSFYPMEVVATKTETAAVQGDPSNACGFALFAERRENPIRMQEYLPARWIENYAAKNTLSATARQNEYFTFQIGIYALKDLTVTPKTIKWGGLKGIGNVEGKTIPASAIRCFNTAGVDCLGKPFTKTITVKAGRVQPMWFGVDIPPDVKPGTYRGFFHVVPGESSNGGKKCSIRITVKEGVLQDRGDSNPHRMTRLRWLDSQIGITDIPPAPFTPVKAQLTNMGWTNDILGRTIVLDHYGMPMLLYSRIDMDQIKTKGRGLKGPVLSLQPGKLFPAAKAALKLVSQTQQRVGYQSMSDQGDYTLQIDTSVEADGYMRQRLTIRAKKDVTLNPKLTFAAPGDTFRYLKVKNSPGYYFKPRTMAIKGGLFDNIIWMGDYNIGIAFKPKNDKDEWNSDRLTNRTTPNPDAWDNNGKGAYTFTVDEKTKTNTGVVSTGEIKLTAGEELRLNYALFLTPFKPLTTRHWDEFRYYHPSHATMPMPVDNTPAPVRVVNLHHASKLNPWINYPFLSVPALKQYADAAHKLGKKVKLYYTVRELPTRTSEIWMLRSLGDEILMPGPGYRSYWGKPQSAQQSHFTRTGGAWLCEHFVHNYISRWHTHVAGISGVRDASISPQGVSRWNNYYLEGQSWLIRNLGIDGVYLDGIGYDREIMRRLRKTMDAARGGGLIDFHGAPFGVFEHLPYINSFWNGEGARPQLGEAYWLIEFSGIPFGTWGELLQGSASPQRGMVFGITKRFGWSGGRPLGLWAWWDSFGIADCTMTGWWQDKPVVTPENTRCKATAFYKTGKKAAIALAGWDNRSKATMLTIDWKTLGLEPAGKVLYAPAIANFQSEAIHPIDSALPVRNNGGMILEIRDTKDPVVVEARTRPAPKPAPARVVKGISLKGHPVVGVWRYGEHTREFTADGRCILRRGTQIGWTKPVTKATKYTVTVERRYRHKLLKNGTMNIEGRYTARKKY